MESFELRDKLVRSHTLPEFEETIDELRKMTEAIMETEEGRQRRREADEMFRQIRLGFRRFFSSKNKYLRYL